MAKKELPEIQRSAVGIAMTFQTKVALTDTTNLKLVMRVGSKKIERDLDESNISDASTGVVVYTTQEEDLDALGTYSAQIIDVTPGVFLPSKVFQFKVVANVE